MNFKLLFFILPIILLFLVDLSTASSQIPPFPPPANIFPEEEIPEIVISGDLEPPEIKIITSEFKAGTNVITIEITDESEVIRGRLLYVEKGTIVLTDLAKETDTRFVALIDVSPPSSVIIVEATDVANNTAKITQVVDVVDEEFNIIDYIVSWFEGLFSRFR